MKTIETRNLGVVYLLYILLRLNEVNLFIPSEELPEIINNYRDNHLADIVNYINETIEVLDCQIDFLYDISLTEDLLDSDSFIDE